MKVLVIEDDEGFGDIWTKILRDDLGYEVEWYKSLEGLSARDLHDEGFDLALVDRRMDYLDEVDFSGEEFAINLCRIGTFSVLVTAFPPSNKRISDLFRNGELNGIFVKTFPIGELSACVTQYEFNRVFPNGIVRFVWQNADSEISSSVFWLSIRARLKAFPREIPDFEEFAGLFRSIVSPYAKTVELKQISGGQSGAAVVRAWVSCDDGDVVEELAIKYGDKAVMKTEAMNYDRFVGPLPDGVAAQLRWRAESRNLGALAYSWVSNSIEDAIPIGSLGSGNLPHLTWRLRRNAINRLFYVSLDRWYRIYRSRTADLETQQSLLDHYTGRDGLWHDKLDLDGEFRPRITRRLEELLIESRGGKWNFDRHTMLLDPMKWVTEGPGSKLLFSRQSPIHGDLHVANIFVLPDGSPRLIDFGKTGLGHVYRDFAALETSVRLACVDTNDRTILMEAEDRVFGVKNLGDHIDYRSLGQGGILDGQQDEELSDLREAVRTTMEIRRAALDAVGRQSNEEGSKNIQEYFFAVVIHMLRYAMGIADEVKDNDGREEIRIWHALYGAARAATAASDLASGT